MIDRVDFWRGFAGGILVGVVVGAFTYFSPKNADDGDIMPIADSTGERTNALHLHRESAENAGDPAGLIPNAGTLSRIDFERPGHPA
jgi:hypothetical protein